MIIHGEKKYISSKFSNEEEIEKVVEKHSDYIFGPDSIYLPKTLIKSGDGVGTIPDGFVIDLANHQWFIVEAELSIHSVWNHIAPQIAKQIIAAQQPSTRRVLLEVVIELVKESPVLQEKFDAFDIREIDIRKFLTEIFDTKPIIGLPIDAVSSDLREWAQTLKTEVKLWIVRKLVEYNNPSNIIYEIPDEYKPVFDSVSESEIDKEDVYYDVQLVDLIEAKYLETNEKLFLSYKPRNGMKHDYEGEISLEGTIKVDNQEFPSLSYAALYCIQNAGSKRPTVNGWTSWKNSKGVLLSDIRDEYLQKNQ